MCACLTNSTCSFYPYLPCVAVPAWICFNFMISREWLLIASIRTKRKQSTEVQNPGTKVHSFHATATSQRQILFLPYIYLTALVTSYFSAPGFMSGSGWSFSTKLTWVRLFSKETDMNPETPERKTSTATFTTTLRVLLQILKYFLLWILTYFTSVRFWIGLSLQYKH